MRTLALLCFVVSLSALALGCSEEEGSAPVAWIREPLEAVWLDGEEAPRLLYTVSYDSREQHRTALMLATAGDPLGFAEGSASDANGNAPAVPGGELTSAHGLWSPKALRVGERSFAFVVLADADGARRVQRVSWGADPALATEGALPGTSGARAFDVAAAGERILVVAAVAQGEATALRLLVLDAEGAPMGEPATLAEGLPELVQGLWLRLRAGSEGVDLTADLLVQSCEGCAELTEESWEEEVYGVATRFSTLGFALGDEGPEVAAEGLVERWRWEALTERAAVAANDEGFALLYWRMAQESFPGCAPSGHCPIERTLALARWAPGEDSMEERAALDSSEIAYLAALGAREGELWALWRQRDEQDRWRRALRAAPVGADGEPVEPFTVAETYTALMQARDWGGGPERLPFEYVDALATRGATDGLWVAMRYRDREPGATRICGEDVRVGIWMGRVAPDGTLLQQSEDRANLALETECGGGGCAMRGELGSAGAMLPLFLLSLLLAARRLVRARSLKYASSLRMDEREGGSVMRRNRLLFGSVSVALLALLLAAGCSSSESGSSPGTDTSPGGDVSLSDTPDASAPAVATVETVVSPESVAAGEEATVACAAVDAEGQPVEVELEVSVEPEGGVLQAGVFTTEIAGVYTFTCALKDGSVVDESPATLTVTPGAPAEIRTVLDPTEIAAGGQTQVACSLVDAWGNEITVSPWIIEHPEGDELNGMTLRAYQAGEHEVRCTAAAAGEVANEPAILTVLPGDAVGIKLKAAPAREWYNQLAQVTFSYDPVDSYGNAVPDVDYGELSVAIEPAGMSETGALRYRFDELGIYTVTGSVPGPPAAQDELELICDPSGPVITIEAPERGLTLDVPAMVTVRGQVVDDVTGVESLTVNGQAVDVGVGGSFSADVALALGMTALHVEATDGVGHKGETIQSVYYSPLWYDMESPDGAWIADSALAFLHPQFFYDRNDPDNFTVSSFLGQIMEQLDLGSLIPNPVAEEKLPLCGETSSIYLEDVRLTVPSQINLGTEAAPNLASNPILNPIDGGLRLSVIVEDFSANLTIDTPGGSITCIRGEGRVYADVTIGADVFVTLTAAGQPNVDMRHVTVSLSNIRIDGFGITGALINLLSEFLDGLLAGIIEDLIVDQLGDILGELGDALVIDETVDIDPFFGEGAAVPLRIRANFDRFEMKGSQPGAGAHINAALAFTAPHNIERRILGSMGRAHCDATTPATFALAQMDDVEIGLFLDAANEALYALWSSGLLHLNITAADLGDTDLSQYGIADLSAETAPLLPPILVDCEADGTLVAQVGDFWAHASFGMFGTPIDAVFYLFAEITAIPVVVEGEEGQEVGIQIGEIRMFQADLVQLNAEAESRREALLSLIEDTAPTVIVSELAAEPITFPIPVFDISGLDDSGMLPPNLLLKIVIDELGVLLGYISGGAHLEQGVPGVDVPSSCALGGAAGAGPLALLSLLGFALFAVLRRRVSAR